MSKAEFEAVFPDQALDFASGPPGAEMNWATPIDSYALAVHPRQVAEARADAAKKGVPVEILDDGRPRFKNRKERKAYMQAYGFYDRDAGYGDAGRHSYNGSQEPGSARKNEQYGELE